MKNKLRYLILGFLICLVSNVSGQFITEDDSAKPKRKISDRLVIGGNFGLSFGRIDYVEISPKVGYKVKPRFVTGIGIKYIYYHEDIEYLVNGNLYSYENKSMVYGGSFWGQYTLLENLNESLGINIGDIVAYAEIEQLNVEVYNINPGTGFYEPDGRAWVTSTLIGGGIYQPIGRRSGIYLLILYNLTDELFSPYENPVIRIGFNF
ncbi:MAG: hypothetical protein U9R19_10165 [Bacteroidota bacterium]|nr:hypothetical protein [Bacteroidota bacterium]